MKRREALKNIGLSTGFVLATPSVFSLLQSCKSDVAAWTPTFLTEEQGMVLKGLIDVILPKTEIPSANDVNVAEFIDKYFDEVLMENEQDELKTSFDNLTSFLKTNYKDNLSKIKSEDYMDLLDNHMILNSDGTKELDSKAKDVSGLLNRIRSMCIHAYRISETVGENILAYDPVPGAAYCDDLEKLTGGKSWSLS
ncbi:gluconate 2-dehydrogenase subunit 3 family protein [Yeosuana sp. MJ-SS3]|uniref:Gluconate 2-dehydrogenase subunit 3 family protein n=1 Tax=Gilvirhabdus luticola TaxID=3079858 RepID=A0ABU3U5Y9_9FLAO|nr:gluconate 2-dehydrogenase subunit 3 family protein [Yeosuana sp. MJ-SS3]MDU8885819.1 gluconate 2-dehydrogenase subunit 3 family protein [Yeosuana sp. MJ-SS3]